METAMKLAIETYSNLTGRTFEDVLSDCNNGNETIIKNIKMLMFATYK